MADQGGKRMKMPKRPNKGGSYEKIHGKKVKIGKGVGERVGRKAKTAIELRREKQRKLLESMD